MSVAVWYDDYDESVGASGLSGDSDCCLEGCI